MKKRKTLAYRRLLLIGAAAIASIAIITLAAFSIKGTSEIAATDTPKTTAPLVSIPEALPAASSSTVIPVSISTEVKPEPEPEKIESLGEFVITAYCPCVQYCGEWSAEHPSRAGTDYIQKTASGTIPTAGRTIGVDPSVIPFGTVVVVNGHEYIAEDRGGAINGNKIDIFFDSHEDALEFGRQTAEIFIKYKED